MKSNIYNNPRQTNTKYVPELRKRLPKYESISIFYFLYHRSYEYNQLLYQCLVQVHTVDKKKTL